MTISSIIVIDGAGDKSDKIVSDGVSHEVTYVHHRSVILPAEPSLCDASLFSAADQSRANKGYTVRSILSDNSAHEVGRDKTKLLPYHEGAEAVCVGKRQETAICRYNVLQFQLSVLRGRRHRYHR